MRHIHLVLCGLPFKSFSSVLHLFLSLYTFALLAFYHTCLPLPPFHLSLYILLTINRREHHQSKRVEPPVWKFSFGGCNVTGQNGSNFAVTNHALQRNDPNRKSRIRTEEEGSQIKDKVTIQGKELQLKRKDHIYRSRFTVEGAESHRGLRKSRGQYCVHRIILCIAHLLLFRLDRFSQEKSAKENSDPKDALENDHSDKSDSEPC